MTFSEARALTVNRRGIQRNSTVLLTDLAGCQWCGLAPEGPGRALHGAASDKRRQCVPVCWGALSSSRRGGGPHLCSLPLCWLQGGCPCSDPHDSLPVLRAGAKRHVQDTAGRGPWDLTVQGLGLGGYGASLLGPLGLLRVLKTFCDGSIARGADETQTRSQELETQISTGKGPISYERWPWRGDTEQWSTQAESRLCRSLL